MTLDIRSWRKIDAAWLSAILATNGIDATIKSFKATPVGTGQIGDCVRFTLEYDGPANGAPSSLVGKFPAEAEESKATGISLGNYFREVKFYQILQSRAGIATPRCYYTELNETTHDFVLIMEDLSPAEQGDQLQGVDVKTARQVICEAAKLHAAFWEDASLDDYVWVNGSKDAPNPIQPDLIASLWVGFLDRYGDLVSARARKIGEAMSKHLDRYNALRDGPRTLVHADFRPDNMLFATPAGGKPMTVVDWQSFGYGPAAADVGYFIAGALSVEDRKANEGALLDLYAAELERLGAGNYPRDIMERHYVSGAYQHFLTAFFAAMLVTQTPRGDDMFFKMLNGATELIFDYGAEAWLDA